MSGKEVWRGSGTENGLNLRQTPDLKNWVEIGKNCLRHFETSDVISSAYLFYCKNLWKVDCFSFWNYTTMFKKICTKLTTGYSFPVIGFWIIAFFFSSLHFITIPFHSRAPASSRGTAPTRTRLLSSISCCFLFVLFGEEVIRLMIIREQHSLFFH